MTINRGARRIGRWLVWLCLSMLLIVTVVIAILRFVDPPGSAVMLAERLANDQRPIRHEWVDMDDISPWMPLAVIASEDQRFLSHWGIDPGAIATAVDDYRRGGSLRGASTITQQTAKNLFLWNGRQTIRKVLEAPLAVGLEILWSKRRIMEVYLNVAEFGLEGGLSIYGVEAASQHFFGISASRLSISQAARLAAVLPSPKRFSVARPTPYALSRIEWIQEQMGQLGGIQHVASLR
ncbi:monofunctional biosynthetic peptidoglycan transglycosylase [Allohahella marinimesophila]|uniref:Biosynthetic peptidoglycan transglycosylase n=1 Tax=Allohahella marinimesophila TaxID=1054972 RepID=A0ABP7PMU9_9GAMM